MTRVASPPFSIQVQGAPPQITGLDFLSNGASPASAFIAFQFLNPHLNGLPIWGPGGAGTTFVWKVFPRQQTGYYVTFWWSNNGDFTWDAGPNSYYGCHPYPKTGNASGTDHNWEIATDYGGDKQITRAGSEKTVVKGRWYSQALRVTRNANGTKTLVFYIDLPSVANADVIQWTLPAGYGERNPPSPAVTIGDSPWYADYQHERLSGIVRGFKIFNKVLSEADALSEAAADDLATADGQANIWWKKINPTPTDLLCEAGTGRNPVWAQSTKAALWTG
ncbi:MAG: hypothetical protein ACRENN_09475 [Candidatus Eiseniibacteriota bacterium]